MSTDIERVKNTPLFVIDLGKIPTKSPQDILSINYEPILDPTKLVVLTAERYNTLLLLSAINKIMEVKKYIALGVHIANAIYIMDSTVDYITKGDLLIIETESTSQQKSANN